MFVGTVLISIDAELGWGFNDFENVPTERIEAARPGWRRLLELLEQFEIPATWAVVGHLCLKQCSGVHPSHPAKDEWFARERHEWVLRPDFRFGHGLVEAISESGVNHEIGSHSFSHVVFDERDTSRELARAELKASLEAAGDLGIRPESFVFPRNVVGYRDLLAEYGFRCYRGKAPTRRRSAVSQSLLRLLRGTRFDPDRLLVEPKIDEYGLVDVPASMYLYSFEPPVRDICEPLIGDLTVTQSRRGIDRASDRNGLFHVWLHPNNLHREYAIERLRSVLSYLADRRDDGDVTVATMGQVAKRVRDGDQPAGRSSHRLA